MEIKLAVAIVHNGRHEVTWNRESADEYNKALDTLLAYVQEAEKKVNISEEVYKQGFIDGLTAYAWWGKEGQEVGTGGTLLKKAVDEVEKTWNYKPSSQK